MLIIITRRCASKYHLVIVMVVVTVNGIVWRLRHCQFGLDMYSNESIIVGCTHFLQ